MSHSSPAFIGSRRLVKAVAARDRSDFSASCAFTHVSMCLWSGAANGSSRIVAVHRAVRAATAAPPDRRVAAAKAKLLSSRIRLRPVSRGGMGKSKELISAISRRYVTRIATRMESLLRLDRFPYNFRLMDESLFDAFHRSSSYCASFDVIKKEKKVERELIR